MAEGVVSLPIWLRTPPCDNQPCTKGPLRPMMDTTRRMRMEMWMTMRMVIRREGHFLEENYKELFWVTLRLMTNTARKRIEMTTVEVQQRTTR